MTYRKAIKEHDWYWNTLLWIMTEGNAASRKELLYMEVREFYNYLSVHEHIIDKRMAEQEKLRGKKKSKKKQRGKKG